MRMSRVLLAGVACFLLSTAARAEDDPTVSARREFVAAADFVREAKWGEALGAFERSAALRPHALTTYNIGACHRALGHYVRARASLRAALAENTERGDKELPASFATQAREYLDEMDRIIAHVDVTVMPPDAELLVDGRPVQVGGEAHDLELDPGAHLLQVTRQGFARAVVSRTFGAGAHERVRIDLERLPGTLRIAANEAGAVVAVGGLDVGVAPVELSRPSGSYPVLVRKPGFVSYTTTVDLSPGGEARLQASLVRETKPLYARPWFWIAAVGVVGAATVTTFLVTRPEPQPPPPDGGGLGWVVPIGK